MLGCSLDFHVKYGSYLGCLVIDNADLDFYMPRFLGTIWCVGCPTVYNADLAQAPQADPTPFLSIFKYI